MAEMAAWRARGHWAAVLGMALGIVLARGAESAAQQRPLVTEDPETVGGGRLLVEAGLESGTDIFLPVSGLTGNLLQAPVVGASVGLSSIAELQVDAVLYQRMHVSSRVPAPLEFKVRYEGEHTADVGDIVLATKLKVMSEGTTRPSLGLRLATKLPNAGNESGLGTDTLDFSATLLLGKTRRSTRYVGNLGIAIIGNPVRGDRQADVLAYGFSLAHAFSEGFEAVGGGPRPLPVGLGLPVAGRRVEGRVPRRPALHPRRRPRRRRADHQDTSRDPGIGFTVGYTHVFDAFPPPSGARSRRSSSQHRPVGRATPRAGRARENRGFPAWRRPGTPLAPTRAVPGQDPEPGA